ncbi:hypothetical protein V5799_000016 [Amblyomma americanum]|uniref:Uncharacterized protein n=1 Tax=Amblyomma americanum TaxID=6943 RepID=A0AAQ4D494_AMBAM
METVSQEPHLPPSKHLALHFGRSRRFQEHVKALASLRQSGGLLSHLRLTYKALAIHVNESRLMELASQYDYLDEFFQDYQRAAHHATTSDNASFFLQYTPSVPKARWDGMLRRYLGVSLSQDGDGDKLRGGVVIQDALLFATLFEVHAKHGEFFTDDFVGGLCVQTLAEYGSFDILASLFGSQAIATQRVYDSCFSNSYTFYGHAIDAYFHQPMSHEVVDLRHTATVVHETFAGQRRRRRMLGGTNLAVNNTSSRHRNFDLALSGLDKLNMMTFVGHYERYPNMTDSPVYDWIHHAAFASAGGLVATEEPVAASPNGDIWRAAGRFRNFRLALAHMEEPFYATNVSAAVLMAGSGARLAAALFYDHVETSGDPNDTGGPANVYAENHECLFPGTGTGRSPDLEIQGAVASVAVAWTAFRAASSHSHSAFKSGLRRFGAGGIGSLKEDELFFVFFCYLFCGDADGERMCNVALQHSADFSQTFGCRDASAMNPVKKCRLIR